VGVSIAPHHVKVTPKPMQAIDSKGKKDEFYDWQTITFTYKNQ
jgi:hypothetical protein